MHDSISTKRPRSSVLQAGTRFVALATACAALCVGSITLADTQVRFKNGQSWRGELNSQVEVVFKENGKDQTLKGKLLRADQRMIQIEREVFGKMSTKTILLANMVSMSTVDASATSTSGEGTDAASSPSGSASGKGSDAAASPAAGNGDKAPAATNYRGVYYLPLSGMVGPRMREDEIKAIGEEADKAGPGQIIVLHIDSGGGAMIEAVEIHKTLSELRKRHRVVAWIRSAISAAAFTAFHCDEIYFEPSGNMGSMTMFSGRTAVQGQLLYDWLQFAGKVAESGGRNAHMARCMIKVELELSYDIPEGGGPKDAIFREDAKGQFVLDTADTMLTLNASPALACGVSDGTAATKEELAVLMKLPEWREVNDVGQKLHDNWNGLVDRCMEEVEEVMYTFGVKDAGGDPTRALAAQIKAIEKLLMWYDRCEECIMLSQFEKGLPIPPKEALEARLKDLRKQLADLRKQERDSRRQD